MPKSKRNKVISLTKVKKRTRERKDKHIMNIQSCGLKFKRLYVVSIENDRNNFLKEVRRHFKEDVLMCGKNKQMQFALREIAAAHKKHRDGITQLTDLLEAKKKGKQNQCCLLFSNKEYIDIKTFFDTYHPEDFARCGAKATETITLPRGFDALAHLPHSIEAHVRALGLPTKLHDGRLQLLADHTVVQKDKEISADQAQVLKLLDIKQAKFKMAVKGYYEKGTAKFEDTQPEDDDNGDDNSSDMND